LLSELYIAKYKNLASTRLSLTARTVLYGRNGAGKTNLLEALALIAGDRVTVGQIAHRAEAPAPGDIEVVLTASPSLLAELVNSDKEPANRLFWSTLGSDALPESWVDGIENSGLPDEMRAALADASKCAVRYNLSWLYVMKWGAGMAMVPVEVPA
jgi:energy-coupling factor transporter ATP-binding protein EcfA2